MEGGMGAYAGYEHGGILGLVAGASLLIVGTAAKRLSDARANAMEAEAQSFSTQYVDSSRPFRANGVIPRRRGERVKSTRRRHS
jgi:hypothetical protein